MSPATPALWFCPVPLEHSAGGNISGPVTTTVLCAHLHLATATPTPQPQTCGSCSQLLAFAQSQLSCWHYYAASIFYGEPDLTSCLGGLPDPAKLQQRQHLDFKEGTNTRKGLCGHLQPGPAALPHATPAAKPAAEPRAPRTAAPTAQPHAAHRAAENSYVTQESEKWQDCVWEGRGEKEQSQPEFQKRLPPSPAQWVKGSRAVCLPVGEEHRSQAPETAGCARLQ